MNIEALEMNIRSWKISPNDYCMRNANFLARTPTPFLHKRHKAQKLIFMRQIIHIAKYMDNSLSKRLFHFYDLMGFFFKREKRGYSLSLPSRFLEERPK